MIDAFHLEVRRELVMVLWKLATPENMYLRLDRNGRSVIGTINVDAVVCREIRIDSMSEAT